MKSTNDNKTIILKNIWEKVLKREDINIHDNFFEIGGNSLLAMQIMEDMKKNNLSIPFSKIFECQTIAEMSENIKIVNDNNKDILNIKKLMESLELFNLTKTQSDEYFSYLNKIKTIKIKAKDKFFSNILITGGTGFFACYLIKKLLHYTELRITLLVRGSNNDGAAKRFRKYFNWYFPNISDSYERIEVVAGDIIKEDFGVGREKYIELIKSVDCVIHTAATIKHYGKWEDFEATNIIGTANIIKFAKKNNIEIHYISTIAGSYTIERNKIHNIYTEFYDSIKTHSNNNYILSKIKAENLIIKLQSEKYPAVIYRLGFLAPSSETGIFQYNVSINEIAEVNAQMQVLHSLLEVKKFPNIMTPVFDFFFVNQAADALSRLLTIETEHRIFHLYNEKKVSIKDLHLYMSQLGYKIQLIEPKDFYALISSQPEIYENIIADILMLTLADDGLDFRLFKTIYNDWTNAVLKKLGFEWETPNLNNLSPILTFLKGKG